MNVENGDWIGEGAQIGKTQYPHEGTDFSGQDINKIEGWQKGLNGRSTIDEQN